METTETPYTLISPTVEVSTHGSKLHVDTRTARQRNRRPIFLALLVLVIAAVLLAIGTVPRVAREKRLALAADAVRTESREYTLGPPQRSSANFAVKLPGSARAFRETVLYARTSGYLRRWLVDIGDKVEAGQTLAEIESPEVDEALNEARARLEEAKANSELAEANLQRLKSVQDPRAISRQQIDDESARVNTAHAGVKVAEATVHRLTTEQSYQRVVAPWAGTVVSRSVDAGALITSGSGTSATALFGLAQTDVLRISVNVPESAYMGIEVGQAVDVRVAERPGTKFTGKVTRTAGAIDPTSRTMKIEVEVQNADGRLVPGVFVEAQFDVKRAQPALIVPATALVIRSEGPKVIVVDGDQVARFHAVKIGRDFGKEIEIVEGLTGDESIVLRPTDALHEGDKVRAAPQATKG